MPQKITQSAKALVEAARMGIEEISAQEAIKLVGRDEVLLVDVRNLDELARSGVVPGAFHSPRGMLEFHIDPSSPYHKPVFNQAKKYVFFCGGGLRSALATDMARRMGLRPVAHIIGGFKAWREAGGAIEPFEDESAP